MRQAYDIRRDTAAEARYAREALETRMLARLLRIYARNAARAGPAGDIREAEVIRQVVQITSRTPRLSGAEEILYIDNLTRLGRLATRDCAFSLRAHVPAAWQARAEADASLQALVRAWLEGGHFLQWGIRFPGTVTSRVCIWPGPTGACGRWRRPPCGPRATATPRSTRPCRRTPKCGRTCTTCGVPSPPAGGTAGSGWTAPRARASPSAPKRRRWQTRPRPEPDPARAPAPLVIECYRNTGTCQARDRMAHSQPVAPRIRGGPRQGAVARTVPSDRPGG